MGSMGMGWYGVVWYSADGMGWIGGRGEGEGRPLRGKNDGAKCVYEPLTYATKIDNYPHK